MGNKLPEEAAQLLAVALGNPVRLPVLIALEERPRTCADLSRELGFSYDQVNHAVHQLEKVDAVYIASTGVRSGIGFKVYASSHTGWASLIKPLERILRSKRASP